MNFIARRKFKRHPELLVRLAMIHFDRPTDLKNGILELDFPPEELIEITQKAINVYGKYPAVQADLRLACLRSICSVEAEQYSVILRMFPELNQDERGRRSLEFYNQKIIDKILGIETSEEELDQYEELVRSSKKDGVFNPIVYQESKLAKLKVSPKKYHKLIDLAVSYDRTLNQLKNSILEWLAESSDSSKTDVLAGILVYMIEEQKPKRSFLDFFVASLRALGENDSKEANRFGDMFVPFISDHRALRSLTVYSRKDNNFEKALRYLRHPNFKHDAKTKVWLNRLITKRRHEILDGKFRPKFQQFGTDFESLSHYVDDIFTTLKDDVDVARYIYSYFRDLYDVNENQFLANELIRWGEAIDQLKDKIVTLNKDTQSDGNSVNTNKKSYERVLRELRRIEDSISLKLGNHITLAARNPFKAILLPFTLPLLSLKLGLQRVGKTPHQETVFPMNEHESRNHSIVLFPTNGVGFGHFTRMYAVARALRKADPKLEIVFFTPMPTLHILYSDNFPTYHLAGRYKHSNMTARQWNGLVEEMLTLIFEMHAPKWFMFDGAFPYRGMLNAIQAQGNMNKLWMHRGTLKKNKKVPAGTIELFDTIIRPQDINSVKPNRINLLTEEVYVPPITLIEPSEMLDADQARAALSVPKDCKLVYVQLGAGRINDISSTVRIVIDELLSDKSVHVVLGESLLGERTLLGLERLHVIRDYPNALFLKAFDASVQAGGYNSFHEMRSIRIPTLFIPNTKTGMDDQFKRVMLSVEEGWGKVIKPNPKEISEGIQVLLSMTQTEYSPIPNGATETANHILGGV